jgi:hypothetical protein
MLQHRAGFVSQPKTFVGRSAIQAEEKKAMLSAVAVWDLENFEVGLGFR